MPIVTLRKATRSGVPHSSMKGVDESFKIKAEFIDQDGDALIKPEQCRLAGFKESEEHVGRYYLGLVLFNPSWFDEH